jgi:acyl carrier protein
MYEAHLLLSKLNALFERTLGLPPPAPDTDLLDSGVLGSLEFAGLLLQVADEFDVKFNFEDMDLDRFRSVAGIASFITQHRTA